MGKTQKVNQSALAPARCLELIEAIAAEQLPPRQYEYDLKQSAIGAEILRLSRTELATLALIMMRWHRRESQKRRVADAAQAAINTKELPHPGAEALEWQTPMLAEAAEARAKVIAGFRQVWSALMQILRQRLSFTEADVIEILADAREDQVFGCWQYSRVVKVVRDYLSEHPLTPTLETQIEQLYQYLEKISWHKQDALKLRQLYAADSEQVPILPGEAWSDCAMKMLETLPPKTRSHWVKLLNDCVQSSGSKPSAKWLKAADPHRQAVGLAPLQQALLQWLPLVNQPRTQPLPDWRGIADCIHDQNADILKGLVWLCADQSDAELARALNQLAVSAYRKLPGIGPRCVKLGNACVWALGQMPTPEAIAQLALLKAKVKFGSAQIGIEKALNAAAERTGMSRDDIEEIAVPTYGLTLE